MPFDDLSDLSVWMAEAGIDELELIGPSFRLRLDSGGMHAHDDLAEGLGPWRMGDDEALLDVLSSANLACGFHAGDPLIMLRTVRLALARNVDIGAHVGFPDRQGFGRRIMHIDVAELAAMVIYQ